MLMKKISVLWLATVTDVLVLFLCGLYLGVGRGLELDDWRVGLMGIKLSEGGLNLYLNLSLRYLFVAIGVLLFCLTFLIQKSYVRGSGLRSRIGTIAIGMFMLLLSMFQSFIALSTKPAFVPVTGSRTENVISILWYLDFLVPVLIGVLALRYFYFLTESSGEIDDIA